MEGDQITYSDRGTPQGGTISPCLANVFLHHVLDEWFVKEVKPRMRGHCFIVRFADDFVIGFQREDDAKRVMEVLPKRFEQYGLAIHPEKSRLLAFGKPASHKEVTRGDNTFDFLGFTHYWARSRQGYWVIKRKTARKKVRKTAAGPLGSGVGTIGTWTWRSSTGYCAQSFEATSSTLAYAATCVRWKRYFTMPRRGMEILAQSTQQQESVGLGEKFRRLLDSMPLPTPKIIHNV